jgi:hypothetical protein
MLSEVHCFMLSLEELWDTVGFEAHILEMDMHMQ